MQRLSRKVMLTIIAKSDTFSFMNKRCLKTNFTWCQSFTGCLPYQEICFTLKLSEEIREFNEILEIIGEISEKSLVLVFSIQIW